MSCRLEWAGSNALEKDFQSLISRCLVSATLRNEVPHLLKFSALMYTLPDYVNREMFEAWRHNLPDPLSPGGKRPMSMTAGS